MKVDRYFPSDEISSDMVAMLDKVCSDMESQVKDIDRRALAYGSIGVLRQMLDLFEDALKSMENNKETEH